MNIKTIIQENKKKLAIAGGVLAAIGAGAIFWNSSMSNNVKIKLADSLVHSATAHSSNRIFYLIFTTNPNFISHEHHDQVFCAIKDAIRNTTGIKNI